MIIEIITKLDMDTADKIGEKWDARINLHGSDKNFNYTLDAN